MALFLKIISLAVPWSGDTLKYLRPRVIFIASNLYKVLNVSEDADQNEIKKAYRKMALLHHPDKKNEEDKAKEAEAKKKKEKKKEQTRS